MGQSEVQGILEKESREYISTVKKIKKENEGKPNLIFIQWKKQIETARWKK